MSRFYIEDVLDALETYLKANLGTKITAINTENSDSVLDSISSNAYLKQFVDDEPNYDPFIVFGVLDPEILDNAYEYNVEQYTIDVIIFFTKSDSNTDYKKAFRYQKALKETIQEGYNDIYRRAKFSVSGLSPVTVQITRDTQQHRATGVSLNVALT